MPSPGRAVSRVSRALIVGALLLCWVRVDTRAQSTGASGAQGTKPAAPPPAELPKPNPDESKQSFWCRVFSLCGSEAQPARRASPTREQINFKAPGGVATNEPNRKVRIAIMLFDDTELEAQIAAAAKPPVDVGGDVTDYLTSALSKDARVTIVSRSHLDKILAEQNFSASAHHDPQLAAQIGKMLGADIILFGNVAPVSRATGVGGGLGRFGMIKARPVEVQLNARLIDANTGQVIASSEGKGSSSVSTVDPKARLGTFAKTSGSRTALETALVDAAAALSADVLADRAHALAPAPIEGRVADVDGARVIVTVGSQDGVKIGDELAVERVVHEIRDPVAGEVLSRATKATATVRVVEVSESAALAEIVSGADVRVTDVVKRVKP